MIREERSPQFWRDLAQADGVREHTLLAPGAGWEALLGRPDVMAYACNEGGYLFACMDGLGRAWELHSLFRPEGWGRIASKAGKAALRRLPGWDLIVTYEVAGHWRSQPPRSFGFKPAADAQDSAHGMLRTWTLTRLAWEQSPARRRME